MSRPQIQCDAYHLIHKQDVYNYDPIIDVEQKWQHHLEELNKVKLEG